MKKGILILLALGFLLSVFALMRNSESGADFLDAQFAEMVDYIPQRDKLNPKVSQVDVAWHLDHSLKTINKVCEALEASNPEEFRSNFSLSRIVVFTCGVIPRGVAQSPQSVRPPKVISTDSLYLQLEQARENLKKLETLDSKAHFEHPYFKVIDKGQSMRFLKIHTQHHVKIIRDILGQ